MLVLGPRSVPPSELAPRRGGAMLPRSGSPSELASLGGAPGPGEAGGLVPEEAARACHLEEDVARAFLACDTPGWGGAANALPRLRALSASLPSLFPEVLLRCGARVLSAAEPRAGRGRVAEAMVELLALAAAHAAESPEGASCSRRLLEQVLRLLGGERGGERGGHAPRDKAVRHRCAEVLWRLLASAPPGELLAGRGQAAVEVALLRLSRDRVPLVRQAAVPGLGLRDGAPATEALMRLAAGDPVSATRLAALAQLRMAPAGLGGRGRLALLGARSLDASPRVRCGVLQVPAT